MGDARYKWTKEVMQKVAAGVRAHPALTTSGGDYEKLSRRVTMPGYSLTPPYVTARPEVTHTHITGDDKFYIVASDGIWDVVSSEEAVKVVGEWLDNSARGGSKDTENAATALMRHVLEKVPEQFQKTETGLSYAAQILALSPKLSRNYRDDLTVTVVLLPGSGNTESLKALGNEKQVYKFPSTHVDASFKAHTWKDTVTQVVGKGPKAKL